MKRKMIRNRIIIIFMFILGMIGLGLFSYNYILSKIHLTYENVNMTLHGNKEPEEVDEEDEDTQENNEEAITEETTPSTSITNTENYIAYLEIPKINLKQGFYDINSENNTVNKGIQIIYPSSMPDVENSNLILASHSGTAAISYFKNLYLLENGDSISVYYNGIKYNYKIVNIYNVPKTGQVTIYRNENKTVITLITCTKNSDTEQTVYIGEIESMGKI